MHLFVVLNEARPVYSGNRSKVLQCDESSKVAQYRGVEQLVARKSHKLEVVGSSPTHRNDFLFIGNI